MENTLPPQNADGIKPSLPCVEASEVILRATDRAFHDIRRLAHVLSGVNLDSRREDLLDYIRLNRARFIKAYTTICWLAGSHGELVVNAGNALSESRFQREQIDTCQDQLFFMHGALFRARQRMYDVPVAAGVLVGGEYPRLPKGIQYCGGDIDPRPIFELPANREEILPRVERAIRLALLRRGGVPSQFTSHVVSNGILTLLVEGEFQIRMTLLEEREDAQWALLGVDLKVRAREGEAITAPEANARQQRYLHEVVQKAMDKAVDSRIATESVEGRSHGHEIGSNPLFAAYQVCHDLCCSMVLGILHGQAQKLSARIGGLWASHLEVVFYQEAQILDLCLWRREFSTGLAGTGQEVGIGGVYGDSSGFSVPQRSSEILGLVTDLPPPPVGCRYVRLHRPVDIQRQMVASLGPEVGLQRTVDLGNNTGNGPGLSAVTSTTMAGEQGGDAYFEGGIEREARGADETGTVVNGIVHIRADKLSCSRILLAASRTFATLKIEALASDVLSLARQLGISPATIRVTLVGGLTVRISSSKGNGTLCVWLEVSVDIRSGRYLVRDSGFSSRKRGTADFVSRLEEALNLLPCIDSQSLGEKVVRAVSTGGRDPNLTNASTQGGQQQDLRQQQVHRCLAECFGVLRMAEIGQNLRCLFGLVPHQRWQALLGRADAGGKDSVPATSANAESGFRIATYCLIQQFREDKRFRGYRTSEESRRGRLGRRGSEMGMIQAASVVKGSNGAEGSFSEPLCADSNASVACQLDVETSKVLSFFLEIGIADNLDLKHTLLVATLPKTGSGRGSLRQAVEQTYPLHVHDICYSSRSSYFPREMPPQDAQQVALLGKRPASFMAGRQFRRGVGLVGEEDDTKPIGCAGENQRQSLGVAKRGVRSNSHWWLDDVSNMSEVELLGHEETETGLYSAVRMAKRVIPFARLQHALLRLSIDTAISLDIQSLTHIWEAAVEPPSCPIELLVGRHGGWSSPEVAAESARVKFYGGHVEADRWEWDVTLRPGTMIMDYAGPGHDVGEASSFHGRRVALELVRKELPLIQHTLVRTLKAPKTAVSSVGMNDPEKSLGKRIKFRFPPLFSVDEMCRSFALSGEGLAAMRTLAAQAADLQASVDVDSGVSYGVLSFSPIHVAMHDTCSDHLVILTHSAFSGRRIDSQERTGLMLIPLCDDIPTCPVVMQELEAAVTKHGDLRALLHGLSRTIPVLAAVSRVVPGIGGAAGAGAYSFGFGRRNCTGSSAEGEFVLAPVSPACFVLSTRFESEKRPPLTLIIEEGGNVRVAGLVDRKDDVVNVTDLQDLLLEWIATGPT